MRRFTPVFEWELLYNLLGEEEFVGKRARNLAVRELCRFDLNQIRKITQQAQDDLRSSCEDRETLARFEAVNEELTELTNEHGKLHADIKQMKIWMEGDGHESKITGFASEAMRFTEHADDYEAKIARLQEKLPALNAMIYELGRRLNQIELELLEP